MLLIPCPWCGPRGHNEFTYGGDATVPHDGEIALLRDNPRGPHEEWWHHSAGCRTWLKLRRDTATHEILDSLSPPGRGLPPSDGPLPPIASRRAPPSPRGGEGR